MRAGDLVSRVSGDAERVTDVAEGALGSFIAAALAVMAALGGLATLDWRFALGGLLAVPVQVHTLRWYLRVSRPLYAAGRIADGRRAAALLGGFTALPTLRALGLGKSQRARIEAASAGSMDYEFRVTRAATRFYGRLNIAEFVGLGTILLVAFLLVRADHATVGAATTAALFFAGIFNPINTMLGVFDGIQQAGAGLARLVGIAAAHRAGGSGTTPHDQAESRPGRALDVAGVRFGYGTGPDVLHGVDLRLEPGEHIAIVGTTGSGKSTLASLLAGVRRPREGRITLGDVSAADLDEHTPHTGVALVTQETHLFTGTIADNLPDRRDQAEVRGVVPGEPVAACQVEVLHADRAGDERTRWGCLISDTDRHRISFRSYRKFDHSAGHRKSVQKEREWRVTISR